MLASLTLANPLTHVLDPKPITACQAPSRPPRKGGWVENFSNLAHLSFPSVLSLESIFRRAQPLPNALGPD